jgi:hypothetical protein
MVIKVAKPPLFDEIDAAFHVAGQPVIFAWGDTIYNPEGGAISVPLQAHEAVHGQRQAGNPESWWRAYIADPEFRLAEEIPAHQVEYRELCRIESLGRSRSGRRRLLRYVAIRLCSPLYGQLITYDRARKAIKEAA